MQNPSNNLNIPDGVNFAPIKPILDLKDNVDEKQVRDHYLVKELRNKYDDLINKDKDKWRTMIRNGRINAHFIQGEQVLKINSFNGMPYVKKADQRDPHDIKSINDMQFFSTVWQDKWRSSKPDIRVEPYSNADEAIAQARKANAVVDYLESSWYQPRFDLHEGLMAQIWGWYGRRVRPDFTSKSFSAFKQILGDKKISVGKSYGKCECGYTGSEVKLKKVGNKEMKACPKCESLEFQHEPPSVKIVPKVIDREKIFFPEIICEELLFPAIRFDLSKTLEVSSWMIYERSIEEGALRRIIGKIRFPEGESPNDFGLDAVEDITKKGKKLADNKIVLSEMYLSADDLWDIRIGGEEKTVEGRTLPKNKRMSEVFPCGCFVLGINGMALILGIYAAHHSDTVTSGVYHMKPMSGAGRGVDDAVEDQKMKNRRLNQIDGHYASRGTPATLIAKGAMEDRYKRQLHNPRAIIPIEMSKFPDVKDLAQLIRPLQGESLPGDLIATLQFMDDHLQRAYHTTNLGGANPTGVPSSTATYFQIADSNADAVFSPVLSIKADVCLQTVKKGFNLWTHYTPTARFLPFKVKPKSGAIGFEVSGQDVKGEYMWSYVPGSEAPKSRYTEMQKRVGFFSMFQNGITGWLEARKAAPKEIAEIERDFDVNFESESYDAVGEMCRARWEKAKQLLGEQQQLSGLIGADAVDYLDIIIHLKPKMMITEPSLMEQGLWFQNLLVTEEGQVMPDEERELASAIIMALKELAKGQTIEIQKDASQVQIESNQPVVDAQNAQTENEAAANQAVTEQQIMAEGLKVLNQNEQADKQREHQEDMKATDAALQIAQMENQTV